MRRETDEVVRGFLALNALLREELRDIRRLFAARASETKYNPNWRLQPRAPVGTREGGRWIDGGGKDDGPKRNSIRTDPPRRPPVVEPRVDFFDDMEDNPYIWELTERGLLNSDASVADFFNLRYRLVAMRGQEFEEVANTFGMTALQLYNTLEYGASVMSERATDTIDRLFDNPGIAGLNIVAREEALLRYVELSGVRPEYQRRMFLDILQLAGFTEEEYEFQKRALGIGGQIGGLVGAAGPRASPTDLPRARIRRIGPRSVWRRGPATRGRIIEAARGHNMPSNYPVIDRFGDDGIATSIKSIDLGRRTYLRPRTLERRLRGLVNQVAGFNGRRYAGRHIQSWEIRGRALELVVPYAGSAEQQAIIDATRQYARTRGVTVDVIIYP